MSDDFFASVRPAEVDELVSRPESLDLLSMAVLDRIGAVFAFDDGAAADLDDGLEQLSAHDPGRPLVGLHAKVFAFEQDGRGRLFLGSANATGAALRSNVEVLVEMQGSVGELGIDRLCEGTADELGLRSLFTTYVRADVPIEDDQDDAALDGARQAIARMGIEGTVEESGSGWAITYRSPGDVPVPDAATVHCWPLASPGNRRRVAGGESLDVRFETTIETISGFLAFEIVGESGGLTGFVVPVPLKGVPEHRERLLLRALIGNAERFLRYLLALLYEDAARVDLLDAVERSMAHVEDPRSSAGEVVVNCEPVCDLLWVAFDPGVLNNHLGPGRGPGNEFDGLVTLVLDVGPLYHLDRAPMMVFGITLGGHKGNQFVTSLPFATGHREEGTSAILPRRCRFHDGRPPRFVGWASGVRLRDAKGACRPPPAY